jgi:O-antigen/teichoic acid export membrane protein
MYKEKSIKISIITSFLSKLSTLALQLYAMPLAAKQLGTDGFVIYSMMMGVMGWLMLSSVGVGPAITVIISPLRSKQDRSRWFSSALFISTIISVLIFFSVFVFTFIVDIKLLFISGGAGPTIDVETSFYCILVLFILQNFCTVTDAVILASQRQYITNFLSFLSSVISLIYIMLYGADISLVSQLLLVILAPVILLRLLNAGRLLLMQRYVTLAPLTVTKLEVKRLITDGKNFLIAGSITNLILHVLPILIIGRFYDTLFSAQYVALNNIIVLGSGLVSMVCVPLIPAIAESVTTGDFNWANRVYKKLLRYVYFISALTVFFGWFFGQKLLNIFFDNTIDFQQDLVVSATLYFCLLIWTNIHVTVLSSIGEIKKIAKFLFIKAILFLITLSIFLLLNIEVNPFYVLVFWSLIIETKTLFSITRNYFCDKNTINC